MQIRLSGQYVEMEECPRCHVPGKRKCFALYADGHGYCYYCNYFQPRDRVVLENSHDPPPLALPRDCTHNIGNIGLTWLSRYGINRKELVANDIQWSPFKQMVCFPYYEVDKHLAAWQGRDLLGVTKNKWFSQGNLKDHLHLLGTDFMKCDGTDTCVIVEDVVSAIKVARYACVVPIFGSYISSQMFTYLDHCGFDRLIIWFDPDARLKAIKMAMSAQAFQFRTKIVVSEYDPKEEPDDKIKEYVK